METQAHHILKRLAAAYLRANGCSAVAVEVRCPISRYRIDVAGYQDVASEKKGIGLPHRQPARTIVIECKQSRSDFLRDSERAGELLALRAELDCIRRSIQEHRIKRLEPQLRRKGTSLFAELDDWDFTSSRLPSYRKVLRQLRRIDEKLHGETKFFLMARYALADQLYLAAPQGMIRPRELPLGWGLLECSESILIETQTHDVSREAPGFSVRCPAPEHASRPTHRARMLRNIAVAASIAMERLMNAQAPSEAHAVATTGP